MPSGATRTALVIMGMRDNACREHIVGTLESVDGVKDVVVSLPRGRAVIVHEPSCDLEDLMGAIVRAGYGAAPATTDGRGPSAGGASRSGA